MKETKPAPGPWTYDESLEQVYDAEGHIIGRFEPASGFLAAAAWDLLLIANDITHPVMTHQQLILAVKRARHKAGLE